jgi:hypothetical protein
MVGMMFYEGDMIQTGVGSQCDLFLKMNGPVVRLLPDTILGLDKLRFKETQAKTVIETALILSAGRILGNVKKLAAESSYKIKMPRGTCSVRNTEYDISADGWTFVISGTVQVVFDGKTFLVKAGEGFNPENQKVEKTEPIGVGPIPTRYPNTVLGPQGGLPQVPWPKLDPWPPQRPF